jgi:glycosyltransferase involved in cell wall biosynthesis
MVNSLNIAINGLFLKEKGVGLGKYSYEIIKNLDCHNMTIHLFIPSSAQTKENEYTFTNNIKVHIVDTRLKTGSNFIDWRLWEMMLFNIVRKEPQMILFSPYFVCSPNIIRHEIVSVGDVIQHVFPQYGRSMQELFYHQYNTHYIKHVKKVITFSEYSKKDIIKYLHLKPDSIYPIHLGVSELYRPMIKDKENRLIINAYKLPEQYILYVGGYDYRKNVIELIQAFRKLKSERNYKDLFLLMVGAFPKKVNKSVLDIDRAIKESGVKKYIISLGYVPEKDLPYIYSLARVFVYPSAYEGFGLPILESIACGTPAIACNVTSIPEILNREDILYNPGETDVLMQKIKNILESDTYRKELCVWGIVRSKEFTWHNTARQIEEIFNSEFNSSV